MNEKEIQELMTKGRNFMHMPIEDPEYKSDQDLKKQQPPLAKAPMCETQIDLPTNFNDLPIENNFLSVINNRASHRVYTEENMTLLQLSFILWVSQGVKEIRGKSYATLRTVPSGGARHPFECYMALRNVEGLKDGFYHYLPMTHQLECISECEDVQPFFVDSLGGPIQGWCKKANIIFYLSMVAYRAEWRYGIYAHRVALIDSGHVSQNIYLACQAIGLGGCAVGYIDEKVVNPVFKLDGTEEFIFYAFPVGTVSATNKQAEADFYSFVKQEGL